MIEEPCFSTCPNGDCANCVRFDLNPASDQPSKLPDPRRKRQDGIRTLEDIKGRCRIDGETGCWHWTGAFSRSKTRKIGPTTRVWLPARTCGEKPVITTAAKAAWLLSGRSLPDGHVVWRQSCTCSTCIRPDHGASGTRQQMFSAIAASDRLKGDPLRAAVNARNRLAMLVPESVVRQAEAMFAEGRLQKEVRAALGLSSDTAQAIRRGLHPHSANAQRVVRGASVFSLGVAA